MRNRLFVAERLREIAVLLRLRGGKPFRARAYETGATAVEAVSDEHFFPIVEAGRLTELPGIGPAIASQITELVERGTSSLLEELRAEFPKGIVALANVPGISLDKARTLHDALGVDSPEALERACDEERVRTVRGFGPATEQRIKKALERYRSRAETILLYDALPIAKTIVKHLEPARALVAGAVRRCVETTDEITVVAEVERPRDVVERFARMPLVARVDEKDERSAVTRLTPGVRGILLAAPRAELAWATVRATGPEAHVRALGERARACGVDLEHGAFETEDDVYRALGLAPIAPELRDDPDALARAAREDAIDLVEATDVRGIVHCHTTYSDGRDDIEGMARAADALGMEYLTITDHSPTAHYAGGVERDRLERQWDEIARVQERVKVRLLRGTESDILADGALDYPDAVLERLDVVIASIHARNHMDEQEMTRRLVRAMRQPVFKIWGHPLGRLLLRRDPVACDVEAVLDAAAESRVAIEINGDPYRLDLPPRWIGAAKKRGLKFVVSTDAHSANACSNYVYAVAMARRGGLARTDVLNTRSADAFLRAVQPRAHAAAHVAE